jgi:lipase maturation factor 1
MDDGVMFADFAQQPAEPLLSRWFAPGAPYIRARWFFLRALGLIFFSAFFSLWFQIHGLIGERGILPANEYLQLAKRVAGGRAYWLIPSLLWISARDWALTAIVVIGVIASLAIVFNFWPRTSIAIAMISFLSFIAAAQDFASYQSDGMLLEAAFLSLFLGSKREPPSYAAVFVLRYEWFRIYFESGLVKLLSGEEQWRNLTAMDKYYENGPLPTWIGWYAQQLPHSFHAATAALTLFAELFLVWLMFVPSRRVRIGLFIVTSLLQIGIIITANYAFLNYLVLALGILLVEDRRPRPSGPAPALDRRGRLSSIVAAVVLTTHVITTTAMFLLPNFPTARLLAPSRIVNSFGLFAVMTRARYEIEFQGTRDGVTWIAYPFRYKPQDVKEAPRIYAPYQPRFDWNLWFASLGTVEENPWVINVEERLVENSPPVLELFRSNPFGSQPPAKVRAVLCQYWFTTREERARTGAWWNRKLIGEYAPEVTHELSGAPLPR